MDSIRKKICILIPGLEIGGIENYVLRFLSHLQNREFLTIVVRDGHKGILYDEYCKTGVNINFQRVTYINPYRWLKLYQFFKKNDFKTVCDFNGNFSGIPMLMARFAGVRNRITFYRRSSNAFKGTPLRRLYNMTVNRLVYYNSTKILSNSKYAIEFFFPTIKLSDMRFKVIPNGISPEDLIIKESKEIIRRELNLPIGHFIIGHVGRFDPSKNHEFIFKVAQRLCQNKVELSFIFIGKGTDSQAFNSKLYELGIENICYGLGLQTQMPKFFRVMDLFFFPSKTEGQPNALIEAMMAGLPILASDIPSIKECIKAEKHNQLIDPTDIEAATNEIIKLYRERSLLDLRIHKKEAIAMFSLDKNYKLFLQELL